MANVLFRRGTQEYINNNVPISDGQVVFNETDQAIYVDTPVNNVITRLRYGGGNLSRSDIDSALSDTSENPVQNKVITESVLQKTDIVNDYNTAVAVTATDIPVGCGVIKTANTKIGDLQTALNTTNRTVAQHTTDISALNTGLTSLNGTVAQHTADISALNTSLTPLLTYPLLCWRNNVSNANSIYKSGIYGTDVNTVGVNNYGIILLISNSDRGFDGTSWLFQILLLTNGAMKLRYSINQTSADGWSAWKEVRLT